MTQAEHIHCGREIIEAGRRGETFEWLKKQGCITDESNNGNRLVVVMDDGSVILAEHKLGARIVTAFKTIAEYSRTLELNHVN